MTSSHFIFIPAVIALGIVIGFVLGTRAAQDRMNLEARREKERAEARARRAARLAKEKSGEPVEGSQDAPATEGEQPASGA